MPDHRDQRRDHRDQSRDQRDQDSDQAVEFDHCSAYFSCRRCGAMVAPGERDRHRRWHRSSTTTTRDQEDYR